MSDTEHPELVPGTLVICRYRMSSEPPRIPLWIGIIEEPGEDPAEWNGTNSEKYYCTLCKKARVRYTFGIAYDTIETLTPISSEEAALYKEKGCRFPE